jgi:hypothetical protein
MLLQLAMAGPSKPRRPVPTQSGDLERHAPDRLEVTSRYVSMRGRGLWFIGAFDLFLAIATLCFLVRISGSLLGAAAVFIVVAAVSFLLLVTLQSLVLFVRLGDELIPTLKKRCRDYLLDK